MLIALAQINPTIGDIAGNCQLIADAIEQASARGADLIVLPELAVLGYPPKDLLLKPAVIEQAQACVQQLAARCVHIAAIIGYPCVSDLPSGRSLFNAAAVCQRGRVVHRAIKSLLPTYDVFDETRYFEPGIPGQGNEVFSLHGVKLGLSICEDLWNQPAVMTRQLYPQDPIATLAQGGAQVLINSSASPFVVGKHEIRKRLFEHAAKTHGFPVLYCNQVGGNDELVFDGCSCAVDREGKVIAQAKAFEPDLLLVNLPEYGPDAGAEAGQHGAGEHAARPTSCGGVSWTAPAKAGGRLEAVPVGIESIYDALVLGLRDYCRKCGFRSVVLGLSGGIDSAVTAALCVAALGAENVRGVAMPSRFSSQHSIDDARELARRLGIRFDLVPIHGPHDAFEAALQPVFAGIARDVTEENIQARVRGVILMAISNKFNAMLVTTGNKSEIAVGYCTLYGDMAGGLAVISDVPKTAVWQLARWINESPASPLRRQLGQAVIPESSITKVPSAELRPNQTDQDSLPPYEVLDQIIEKYVEQDKSVTQIVAELPDVAASEIRRVVRMIDLNEYKRKQAAPGIKVTGKAFGFGRRMPIAQRYRSE